MLVKGTDIIKAKIYTIDKGKAIEDVDDVIYNPKENRVEAFLVNGGGLFSEPRVVLLSDAAGVGRDAIVVENEAALKSASELKESLASIVTGGDYLTQDKIITEEGADLGKVTDILFDSRTGEVREFEVSRGLEDVASGRKRVKISDIITVGEDAVIVRGYTEEKFEEQARTGGIRGAITRSAEQVRKQTPQVMGQARTKAQELAERAKREAQEFRQRPETQRLEKRARMGVRKIQVKARETAQIVKEKAQKVKESPQIQRGRRQAEEEARYLQSRAVQAMQTTKPKIKKTGRKIKRKVSSRP